MKVYSTPANLKKSLGYLLGIIVMLSNNLTWAAPKGSPWGANYFPNIELIDQHGKTVHFYDDLIKDKIVAVNFIYTHCNDVCPAQTANLRQVYRLLSDIMGKEVFFYSISIDPEHDTPETLTAYAKNYKLDNAPGWFFLTGKKEDTALLRKKLGLLREGKKFEKLEEHNTSFLIGNEKTGQWLKRSAFDEPKTLAWLLGSSLSNFKSGRRKGMINYSDAQARPKMERGEDLFNSRCDSCHSLGEEEGIGPGLFNITQRRDRAWLIRWIKQPDKLLAEKDPIAMALFEKYNKILMPNLQLTDTDVEKILQYIEKENTKNTNNQQK